MTIPDELWAKIRAMAEQRLERAMADIDDQIVEMAEEHATKFVDASTLEGTKLLHVATGRTLSFRVKWDA